MIMGTLTVVQAADSEQRGPDANNVVAKAVIVLQALRRAPDGASARQLSSSLDLPRSTIQRLLSTLAASGMVAQDPVDQRYRIGPQALLIGLGYRWGLELVSLARPHLLRARDELGFTARVTPQEGLAAFATAPLRA